MHWEQVSTKIWSVMLIGASGYGSFGKATSTVSLTDVKFELQLNKQAKAYWTMDVLLIWMN